MAVWLTPFLLFPALPGHPPAQNEPAAADYARGLELAGAGRWLEALGSLEQAAASAPQNAQYQKALGVAYAKLGDHAAAAEPLGRACRLDPTLPDVCYYWSQSLIALSRFEDALRALDLSPPTPPGRHATAQAHALEGLGRESAAEIRYRTALKAADYRVESRLRFGIFLYRHGRAAEAVAPLEEAARLRPQAAEIALELGRVYLQLHRLGEAENSFRCAEQLDPSLTAAKLLLDRVIRRRQAP